MEIIVTSLHILCYTVVVVTAAVAHDIRVSNNDDVINQSADCFLDWLTIWSIRDQKIVKNAHLRAQSNTFKLLVFS